MLASPLLMQGPEVGVLFVALCADYEVLRQPSEVNRALWQAHYYRKAVEPVLLMQLLVAILFAGGLANYGATAVELVRSRLPTARRVADTLGVGPSVGAVASSVCSR
jgi:hypothetical protein